VADEVLIVLNDKRQYLELLFDLADNGRIDSLENRSRITMLRDALTEALV
jgi:hypothetical protein